MDALFCCLFLLLLFRRSHELELPFGPTGHVNETDGRLTLNFLINFNMTAYLRRATVTMAADDWTGPCKNDLLPVYLSLIDSTVNNRSKLDLPTPFIAPFTSDEIAATTTLWRTALEVDIQRKVFCLKHVLYGMNPVAGNDSVNAKLSGVVDTTVPNWMLQHFMEIAYAAAAMQGLNATALGERYFGSKVLDPAVLDWQYWINSTGNMTSLDDFSIILAQCANQTFYHASIADVYDRRTRNGLFLWMVEEVLRSCCKELIDRPANFTDLVRRVHGATVEKAKIFGVNIQMLNINFIWNFITNGWLLQLQQFFHNLDNAYGIDNPLFVTHVPSEDPISRSVMIVSLAINTIGNLDTGGMLEAVRYQTLLQNLTLVVGKEPLILWLFEDTEKVSHQSTALAATIVSWLNFATALAVTGYFVRQLRQSERYQLPMPKEEETYDDMES